MRKVRVVATSEWPMNKVGWLVPIFVDNRHVCFQPGMARDRGVPFSVLEKLTLERAIVQFEPRQVEEREFLTSSGVPTPGSPVDPLGLPSQVFYFTNEVAQALEPVPDLEELCANNRGIRITPIEGIGDLLRGFSFYLFTSRDLRALLTYVFRRASMTLERSIKEMCASGTFLPSDKERLLSRIMSLVAVSDDEVKESVRYEGLVVLCGPHARNYRVWLAAALTDSNIEVCDPDHWRSLSLGILDEIQANLTTEKIHEALRRLERSFSPGVSITSITKQSHNFPTEENNYFPHPFLYSSEPQENQLWPKDPSTPATES